jgi:TolB-like protein/class 3 adenylate cyclase/Tfp pilus assembly protein PilF
MAGAHTNRRLAAILAADVVGYSRMMASDEAGTLAALKHHRDVVFDPAVAEHNGRVVKLIGDGTLVEFGSVVDAVNCALSVQRTIASETTPGPKITLRIGVNLGDIIIIDGDDIYGDGVNIAARLEPLAEPGGVCISAIVNESVGGRVDVTFQDGGEVQIKNVDRPIRIWKWHPEKFDGERQGASAQGERGARPSLAVLPFQNLSGDPAQDYFADGVVEDMITALSRFKSFAVVARNSSFVYKGRTVDVRQVARELGVRYVLEGSVRKAGSRLRITAQLIDGTSGAHMWAHNYDGTVEDIFDVQDRITESVVAVVEPQIQQAEIERSRRKRPENLDAYDLYLRALRNIHAASPEKNAAALELLNRAIELDPGYAGALAVAAWGLEHRTSMGWPPLTADDRQRGVQLARAALAVGGDDPDVVAHCALVILALGREYDQGLEIVKRAVEANPNDAMVLTRAGICHLKGGSLDEAMILLERVIRLSPGDTFAAKTGIANVHLCLGRYQDALDWAGRSLAENPRFDPTHWMLIAANAHLGRLDEARRALAVLLEIMPGTTVTRVAKGQHSKDPRRTEVLIEGLRLAGMPEG